MIAVSSPHGMYAWERKSKKGKGADLNDVELAANCLLNVLFIGRHPQGFDKDYKKLLK